MGIVMVGAPTRMGIVMGAVTVPGMIIMPWKMLKEMK